MSKALVGLFAGLLIAGCQISPECACGAAPATEFPLTVFAASSLQPAFDKIGKLAKQQFNLVPTFDYAGTQTLVSQVIEGASGDIFASADTAHMAQLQTAGLLLDEPTVFAHNKLEIAVEKGNPKGIHTLADLARPGLVVVLADQSVPAGKYAQQALAKAKVTVHPASFELQVTAVLSKVALGEADAGIVYVSDVVTSAKVDGVAIPDDQNVIADYPISVLKSSRSPGPSHEFVYVVMSAQGQAILKTAGFEGV